MEMQGAATRRRRQAEDDRARAWMAAYLARVEKFPKFDDFVTVRSVAPPKRQSPEVLQAMCDALARTWGAKEVRH